MSDAWEEIQAVKSKRNSLREKLEKRKKERQSILGAALGSGDSRADSPGGVASPVPASVVSAPLPASICKIEPDDDTTQMRAGSAAVSLERRLLEVLSDLQLQLPATARELLPGLAAADAAVVANLLHKFHTQKLIVIKERGTAAETGGVEVVCAESVRLAGVLAALEEETTCSAAKRKGADVADEGGGKVSKLSSEEKKTSKKEKTDIMVGKLRLDTSRNPPVLSQCEEELINKLRKSQCFSLLAMPSSREKAVKRVGEEILDLLSKPTAKERSLADKFKSQGGAQVMEFCPHGTRAECARVCAAPLAAGKETQVKREVYICKKLHFRKIIQGHTDESLGDCSFLNTCFHMDSCKYVHYEVDNTDPYAGKPPAEVAQKITHNNGSSVAVGSPEVLTLHPPQWVQCDLRYLDMAFLGKFAVIMADPPWDIHMELPYGTMSDDEMRRLGVPQLQEQGLIFLWVTGRAMELGRECLKLWGYRRVDELIWVKTNQLQRIIRTGRTGHWLNHGKEHCLVGMKGNPENLNRGLDCDVIVAEVRATSHKPDEIYGIIERLSPSTRKIELFGRPHNVQPNWITLGNQVDGVRLVDPELIAAFKKRYPDGNCMAPPPPETALT